MPGLDDIHEVDNVRDLPLPEGWVKEFDPSNRPLWVDTLSETRRSIRVHPYEDNQYLTAHPEIREKIARLVPPSYAAAAGTCGENNNRAPQEGTSPPQSPNQAQRKKKRNVFGKMKDKAIGTKEERAEAKRQQILREEQRRLQREREWSAYQQEYFAQHGHYPPPPGYGFGQSGGFYEHHGPLGYAALIGGIVGGILLGSLLAVLGGC